MSNIYNMTFDQGETYEKLFSMRTGVTTLLVAGSFFRGQVRKDFKTDVIAATFTFVLDTVNNTITACLSEEATAAMAPGLYVYDIEWVNPAGKAKKILKGRVRVGPEVTRP